MAETKTAVQAYPAPAYALCSQPLREQGKGAGAAWAWILVFFVWMAGLRDSLQHRPPPGLTTSEAFSLRHTAPERGGPVLWRGKGLSRRKPQRVGSNGPQLQSGPWVPPREVCSHGIGGCGGVRSPPSSESTELRLVTKSLGSVKELWELEGGPLKDSF